MEEVTLISSLIGHDRNGELWDAVKINKLCSQSINNEAYFQRRGKRMSRDIDKSTALVDESIEKLSKSIGIMIETENKLTSATKAVSTNVRATTDKLAQGLSRIEKQADFNKLATYVSLLERAEKALSALAELELNGKLERIAGALK